MEVIIDLPGGPWSRYRSGVGGVRNRLPPPWL